MPEESSTQIVEALAAQEFLLGKVGWERRQRTCAVVPLDGIEVPLDSGLLRHGGAHLCGLQVVQVDTCPFGSDPAKMLQVWARNEVLALWFRHW